MTLILICSMTLTSGFLLNAWMIPSLWTPCWISWESWKMNLTMHNDVNCIWGQQWWLIFVPAMANLFANGQSMDISNNPSSNSHNSLTHQHRCGKHRIDLSNFVTAMAQQQNWLHHLENGFKAVLCKYGIPSSTCILHTFTFGIMAVSMSMNDMSAAWNNTSIFSHTQQIHSPLDVFLFPVISRQEHLSSMDTHLWCHCHQHAMAWIHWESNSLKFTLIIHQEWNCSDPVNSQVDVHWVELH